MKLNRFRLYISIFSALVLLVLGLNTSAGIPASAADQRAPTAPNDLVGVYRFSGVTDDGLKGAATRKEATSILCTNIGTVNNQVEVQLYNWSGGDVYTGTVNMSPNATFTFSTQNTTIYFDDIIFGSGGGTDPIFQGSGLVLAQTDKVICTVQVLDPLNYPPVFMDKLPMYDESGILIKRDTPIKGASASNDSPTWLGLSTHLTASVTEGTGVRYRWALGDGTFAYTRQVDHVYPAPGSYTATVTAYNASNQMQRTTTVQVLSVNFFPMMRK